MQVKLVFDLSRFRDIDFGLLLAGLRSQFLIEDLLAQDDAIVADKNAGTGDELFDLGVGLTAEAAQGYIGGSSHLTNYSFLSAKLVACSTRPGISLRDCTTSSTRP